MTKTTDPSATKTAAKSAAKSTAKVYKDTLLLPQTTFPMRANLPQREVPCLTQWQEGDVYAQIRQQRKEAKIFLLHDGPPYANGDIHIGHAVNKILKDMILKYKTLDGYDARYVPGWDCHGLPIELAVEKKLGKPGVRVTATDFRRACRDYAQKQVQRQCTDFQRLGVLADWDDPYLTMAYVTEANIVRALAEIIRCGHLLRGDKPVHWCLDCASALAEAEVEYAEKKSRAIDVAFAVVAGASAQHLPAEILQNHPVVAIWTTTPWTLPANQAVALHPTLDYVWQEYTQEGKRITVLLAEGLQAAVATRWQDTWQAGDVVARGKGIEWEGLCLQHPFLARQVPLVLSTHVSLEVGTGAVHIAPAHGQEDYQVGQKYHLSIANPVQANGVFQPDVPHFAGLHVFKADSAVEAVLQEQGGLLHAEAYVHSYPHCWRHKSAVIFRATPQWFIAMDAKGLREQALAAIPAVQWVPEWGQERIEGMIQERPDWCISRQRTWGVPIALFLRKDNGALHPETNALLEQVAKRIAEEGIEAWFDTPVEEWLGEEAEQYQKVNDILDVWFDSGVTHASVLARDERLTTPADLYLEGSDQHRGWFQSSLLTAIAMTGAAPYRAVLTHGFTVDEEGKKMSKSRGNVVAPQQVIKTLGADVLRLWVCATDYRSEMHVSDEILKQMADAYRKFRNTARYLLANLHGFEPTKSVVRYEELLELDQWILLRTAVVQSQIQAAASEYQFHRVYQILYQFCIVDLSGFYLDVIKDRIYTLPVAGIPRRSGQSAMYHVLQTLVRCLAPIISFTAEEIWQHLRAPAEAESVFVLSWYHCLPELQTKQADVLLQRWQQIRTVREQVAKKLEELRISGEIGSSLEAEVELCCPQPLYEILASLQDELRFVLIVSAVRLRQIEETEMMVVVQRSAHAKCCRCWHLRQDVGHSSEHPELCSRCIDNVIGNGEIRHYA